SIAGQLQEVVLRRVGSGLDGEVGGEIDAERIANPLRILEVDSQLALLVRERRLMVDEEDVGGKNEAFAGPAAQGSFNGVGDLQRILVVGDVGDGDILDLERVG